MKNITDKVKKFVDSQVQQYGSPSPFQINLTNEKGQWLTEKLKANKDIVLLGTLLMDCMLGKAYTEGRLQDHIEMSTKKVEELLADSDELTENDKSNILACVRQHHGAKEFYSLESEICCNADCYKFVSVKGFLGSIHYLPKMPVEELLKLFSAKADEKWNALTIDLCKEELEPQYQAIKNLLKYGL